MEPKSEENGSTNGDATTEKQQQQSDGRPICRDFLNKVCNRGTRCKFFHPPADANGEGDTQKEDYSFCIDYQNNGCFRENCRFVHAPAPDVERFRATGDISNALARAIASVTKKDNINGIPFCKEFQSGRCSRGARCRYWHVNIEAERERRRTAHLHGGNGGPPMTPPYGALRPQPPHMNAPPLMPRRRPGEPLDYGPPSKRYPPYDPPPQHMGGPPPPHHSQHPAAAAQYYAQLEQQNMELRRELDQTQRDLRHERERYDALLAAFPAAQQSAAAIGAHPAIGQPQPSQQPPQQPVYGQPPAPVPPPGAQRAAWGQAEAKQPEWYNNYGN